MTFQERIANAQGGSLLLGTRRCSDCNALSIIVPGTDKCQGCRQARHSAAMEAIARFHGFATPPATPEPDPPPVPGRRAIALGGFQP